MKKIRWPHYNLTAREKAKSLVTGVLILGITSKLFFNTLWMLPVMSPYLLYHLKKYENNITRRRQEETAVQFKDAMMSISAALTVGYSVENALAEALREVSGLYGEQCTMAKELRAVVSQISMNTNVEDALNKMAERIKLEDALYFSEVFRYAKRSGGNLIDIIGKTAGNINDKLTVMEDIKTLISGKRMEQKIMNVMPFMIIAYLRFGAYEFISPMYGNVLGFVTMCVCLLVYFAAGLLSEKIVDIKV